MAENTDDFLSSLNNLIDSKMVDINTSIEGEIVSYANGIATVQPLGNKRFVDGDVLPFPQITNVPVRWPSFSGGQAGIKGPILPGDKCLLVFSQQAIDGSDDLRRFDLSDAYALISGNSQNSQGGNNSDMVMYFGSAYIKISATGGLEINAPAGTLVKGPTNTFQGTINGQAGFNIQGVSGGGTMNVQGAVAINGTITNNGKNIGSGHAHSGVQPGGGVSNGVV